MTKEEFKELYDAFFEKDDPANKIIDEGWELLDKDWKDYIKDIEGDKGLPLTEWLKKDDGNYLPEFLGTKTTMFGHSRIGNYDQVMIYKYTGSDKNRNNKFIDIYDKRSGGNGLFEKPEDVQNNYENHIAKLLTKLIQAKCCKDIFEIEADDENYKEFSNKQILRKITVLMSLTDDSAYKNCFLWIYNENKIKALSDILGIGYGEKTFFQNNKAVYDCAKEYADINNKSSRTEFEKLYNFLLSLIDETIPEFTDFNSRNLIISGAPGTGKTYGVRHSIDKLKKLHTNFDGHKDIQPVYMQFHPSYTYQDFIEGIKPVGITESGSLDLQVVNGNFKQFCIDVKVENEAYWKSLREDKRPHIGRPTDYVDWPHYYFVVDEINRGNLSNIFGETFTLLEYRDYDFKGKYEKTGTELVLTQLSELISKISKSKNAEEKNLVYKKINGKAYFGIPFNIHFVGMMNDVDRSIDAFDLALRRRFKWVSMGCNYDVIEDVLFREKIDENDIQDYIQSCANLNDYICKPDEEGLKLGKTYEIGHAFFLKYTEISRRKKHENKKAEVFDNYLSGTIKEYIRQVKDETEVDKYLDSARKAFGIK